MGVAGFQDFRVKERWWRSRRLGHKMVMVERKGCSRPRQQQHRDAEERRYQFRLGSLSAASSHTARFWAVEITGPCAH